MQRLLAILLLSAINFPLMPLTATRRPDSFLPPCCRINGKHKCALKQAALRHSSVPAIAGVSERCPVSPALLTAVIGPHAIFLQPASLRFGPVPTPTQLLAQTETLGRVPFSRTHQKRGPPVLLLHF